MGNNIWHNEPDNAVVKNPPASVGDIRDMGSILKLGRSPGVGNGNPLQYSCLENPMDRRAWGPTVHRVAEESDRTEQLTNNFVWRSSAPLLSAAPLVHLPGLQSWVCARARAHTHTHTHTHLPQRPCQNIHPRGLLLWATPEFDSLSTTSTFKPTSLSTTLQGPRWESSGREQSWE